MNDLTSRQRKLVYVGAIVALLIPIIWLGMPAGAASSGGGMVGRLAEMRQEYDLGEATLGDVDPSSATMNLVLLGLRGIAANALWHNANEQQKTKEWAKMRSTVDSIILLQPHFAKVWSFQGWNLAFNVSAVHDRVEDRWYWVKEGGKFAIKGTERNARSAYLYSDGPGRIVGFKIGKADEWKSYRAFFQSDPDVARYGGRADPGIATVDGEPFTDHFLAARRWYEKGNAAEEQYEQPFLGTSRMNFRHQPARAQINSAEALQRDGSFGERTRQTWDEAHRLWTEEFGRESFRTRYGEVILNATPDEIRRIARREQIDVKVKEEIIEKERQGVNYHFWRQKCLLERESETQAVRGALYEAKRMFREEPGKLAPTLVRHTPDGARWLFRLGLERVPAGRWFAPYVGRRPLLTVAPDGSIRYVLDKPEELRLSPEEQSVLMRVYAAERPVPRSEFVAGAEISNATLARLEELGLVQSVSEIHVRLEQAMAGYERLLERFPLIANDVDTIEDGLLAVLYWHKVHQLYDRPIPTSGYPLEDLWNRSQADLPAAQRKFMREMEAEGP